jgi:protoporphyrinogen oxidase
MARVIVIGAGPMGMAAAHRALSLGHEVDLVEADRVLGGMAAHFDFGGYSVERFYHFICKSDAPTFDLLDEIGLGGKMRWVDTSMGYFMGGALHKWGDPISLLRFPHLSWAAKFRTGLHMFLTTRARDFASIENLTARDWIERGSGQEVYDKLWKRLMHLKFFEFADEVSASWIAARVKRVGRSRRHLFQEQLGHIEGGTQTLIDGLERSIRSKGGRIHLNAPVKRVVVSDGRVSGVEAGGGVVEGDAVISTVPTPLINEMVPDMPADWRDRYASIRNIGVVCLLFKLRRSVSPHFWVNIVDPAIEIPGLIEYSNLRRSEHAIVYVPYYMPTTHPKWQWTNDQYIAEALAAIGRVNPAVGAGDVIDVSVGRLRYAQPICEPNFLDRLPAVQTPIAGLQIADTCYYYPEDRGVAESVRLGRAMAEAVVSV